MGKESIYEYLMTASDDVCLEFIFLRKHKKNNSVCEKCAKQTKYYRVKNRKCYECGNCGYQIYPLKGTVMQGTKLLLRKWFFAMNEFDKSKNGVSAKELERRLNVTYKVAWAIANKIRNSMSDGCQKFDGIVEVDESYIGGKKQKKNHPFVNKKTIFGMVERKGDVRTWHVEHRDKKTIFPLIRANIEKGSTIYSDEHPMYSTLNRIGFNHDFIKHNNYKWANGAVCTNTIEAFWSLLKRGIRGTYIHVSKKWMQSYLDEFSFRYNRRNCSNKVFNDLVENLFN